MIVILVLAVIFLAYQSTVQKMVSKVKRPYTDKPWYGHLKFQATFRRIPENVALSMVRQESGGNEKALGSAGEVGLFQLKKGVAIDYEQSVGIQLDINDVEDNITLGLWYVAHLRDRWKLSLTDALLAYNSGIGNYLDGRIQNKTYASQILERAEAWA